MIEKMKKISVLVKKNDLISSLNSLRKAGVLHIAVAGNKRSEEIDRDEQMLQLLDRVIYAIPAKDPATQKKKTRDNHERQQTLNGDVNIHDTLKLARDLDILLNKKRESEETIQELTVTAAKLEAWGDFSPSDLEFLHDNDISLTPAEFLIKDESLLDGMQYIVLNRGKRNCSVALINVREDSLPESVSLLKYPELSLSGIHKEINQLRAKLRRIERRLAAEYNSRKYLVDARNIIESEFELKKIQENMETDGPVAWLTGFVPAGDLETFRQTAKEHAWGLAIDDPNEEDPVPTKLKNNWLVRIIKPVFSLLGTIPGYREYDISTFFLIFFTVFCAMIIGDAGYGVLFFIIAIILHFKQKKAGELVRLMYVLSGGTIIWGAVTGTWFGSSALVEHTFLQDLVFVKIASFPDLFNITMAETQEMVMLICFILGIIQLGLACIINFIREFPKIRAVAQLGWLTLLIGLYTLTLNLVLGHEMPFWGLYAIAGGLGLIIIFGEQQEGRSFVKGALLGFAGLFTTFLDSISAFSNIISYIRLFAVGMSSLAISSSFNSIAGSMPGGFAIVAALIILLIGHGLNIVMGLLSVIVHGVRLNLLEFSGQLGLEWSGIAYKPVKEYKSAFFTDILES